MLMEEVTGSIIVMDFAEECLQTRSMDLGTCVWLPIDFGE
jgi:hypothetical protein